jgi:tRNA pseudouridine32 synthase/23S rRNA pseudouridine746 synthase
MSESQLTFKRTWREGDPLVLVDFIETHTKLSKSIIKKVLVNGGCWIRLYSDSKLKVARRATAELTKDSHVEFYFDPKLLKLEIPDSKELTSFKEWGIWHKPAGLLSQGTMFGDHCSILRQVEKSKGKAWLIHRLDREAHGLMIFAYTPKAARLFSELFQERKVRKIYKVELSGVIEKGGEINFKLDGREAKTVFEIFEKRETTTVVLAEIHTGRLHQIRRHFEMVGHPVMGDPKYGGGNKNDEGLKLLAYQLIFIDPFSKKEINMTLPNF